MRFSIDNYYYTTILVVQSNVFLKQAVIDVILRYALCQNRIYEIIQWPPKANPFRELLFQI